MLGQLQAGDTDGPRRLLSELAATNFDTIRRNFLWSVKAAILCEVAEKTGHAPAAARLTELLGGLSGCLAANCIVTFAPIDLALSQAALATGDADSAAAHADTAVRASRTRGTPLFLGRELIRLAEARRRLGANDHEINSLVREALDIADRTEATLIHAEAAHYRLREPKPQTDARP